MLPHKPLLVSRKDDIATDLIALELESRGQSFTRLNVDAFPTNASVAYEASGHLVIDTHDSSEVIAGRSPVWCRGIQQVRVEHGEEDYVAQESTHLLRAVFDLSPVSGWLSHPSVIDRASRKPLQLGVAASCGLSVPATLFSNDVSRIRDFLGTVTDAVAKPVAGGMFSVDGVRYSVYTAELHESDLPSRRLTAPLCVQQRVRGDDLRVTVIGSRLFGVRITTARALADWRLAHDSEVSYSTWQVPSQLAKRLTTLLRQFHLRYGAIDLIACPDGSIFFLELNPAGQWRWLEDAMGVRLTALIVDELLSRAT
jgi:glutathione synthase/RimK-type ligase-like ATP-grasp enzyme